MLQDVLEHLRASLKTASSWSMSPSAALTRKKALPCGPRRDVVDVIPTFLASKAPPYTSKAPAYASKAPPPCTLGHVVGRMWSVAVHLQMDGH